MKNITLLFLFCFLTISLSAKTLYVSGSANGNGSSWANAFSDLQTAIKMAKEGDEIWVSKGTYYPTSTTDRSAKFNIPSGVKVYGGFAGNEASLNQRNWKANATVLSGEIGTASIDDNSYTVVYFKNVSAATFLNGFTIKGAAANGKVTKGSTQRCGGAIFNDGSKSSTGSNPSITNCIFINNYAREGAGIYNFGKEGKCSPHIMNCQFIANKADLDGGAIFNNGDNGICTPTLVDCEFTNNEATYGGAILNSGTYNGEASPSLTNCIFAENISYLRGGSLYNVEQGGVCKPIVSNCKFSDNSGTLGKEQYKTATANSSRKGKSVITVRK